jgi:RNA polymerase-binding transcription factor DksA
MRADDRPGYEAIKEKRAMDATEGSTYWDKLRLRASEVERTIRHLEKERQEVEENTEWADRAAYESRVNLLEGLITLYRNETEQIEKAHNRVEERSYGLCLACHEPIEADRLEIYPAAQFCFDCQEYHERLRSG